MGQQCFVGAGDDDWRCADWGGEFGAWSGERPVVFGEQVGDRDAQGADGLAARVGRATLNPVIGRPV